jgi:DNA-binding MarR family transcriptional regulator
MEGTSAFNRIPAVGIVMEEMFQDRDRPSAQQHTIELSEKDVDDVVRLLTLIVGKARTERAIREFESVPIARAILEDRKRRAQIFSPGMFGEPAWELLLNLYVMDKHGPRLTIGRLIQLAGAAPSTSLRWLEYLVVQGLISREQHPTDARTAFVELTDKARDALGTYLSQTLTPRL